MTFHPSGFILQALTILNVIVGVLSACLMPNHAAFMHRDAQIWYTVYLLDILHALFMYAYFSCR